MYSIELLLLCFINVLQTYGAPNSFSVGGRARAPPSFWPAGMHNDNGILDGPAPFKENVQGTPEAPNNVSVSSVAPAGDSNPDLIKEVPLFNLNPAPPSMIESSPKETPLFNAYPQAEPPTNGFWPDPKAVRDFYKRMKDPRPFGSRPENIDVGSRPGSNDLSNRPDNTNSQKESAFIHHADNGDYTQPLPLVTFPPFTFRIIAEPPPTSTPIPFFPPPAPSATPPPVPIEVLVQWIYDEDERNGNMGPGDNSYPGVVIYPQAPPLNPPPVLCNPGRFEPTVPCYLEDTFNPPAPIFPMERPPFLLEAPDDIVAEYFKITMDEKLTKGEMKRALEVWKASLPPVLLQKYEETEAERERLSLVEQDLRAQRVTRLSPLARQVADEIEAIRTNEEFTVMEEEHMIEEILQSIPEDIRQQLLAP